MTTLTEIEQARAHVAAARVSVEALRDGSLPLSAKTAKELKAAITGLGTFEDRLKNAIILMTEQNITTWPINSHIE